MSMAWKPPKLTGKRSTDISGLLFLLIVIIAVASALRQKKSREADRSNLAVGEAMPAYTAHSPDGAAVSLEEFRGKAVLLTFWTRQCSICVDQFAALLALKEELESSGLDVLSVNLEDGDPALVQSYMDALGYDWPNLFDTAEHVGQVFGWGNLLPKTVLVNRDGTVGAWWRGQMDPILPDTRAIIDQAVSEGGDS